ncbi:unnamed protein product, partial [Prorocentrum cordatum]
MRVAWPGAMARSLRAVDHCTQRPARVCRRGRGALLALAAAGLVPARAAMAPLGGEYGFLTEFSDVVSEDTARARVREMMEKFAVREFQFYNAFEGFSRPPGQHLERWHCTFSEQVSRNILRAYTEEIANLGGRSWLLLQMMAVDVGDSARLQRVASLGHKVVNRRPIPAARAVPAAGSPARCPG